ncbi:heme ABC exporter ATP-binding protein CcmA [Allorhizobium sp. BGMRC 0089]|uniref:heme ABC exporter ATP-binding protein CcmA n=1 Tax=Allorhizobium sonneratiae TaxID=2934936 RepID=UPI00203499A5|nr:heme ABC exporter ATP-binding protein CcmA [Allorhizobium sonneratiae]MCM2293364.1 heme ABC exporter ATP-binding protein CcmA [Allorhizobium sonneratiae]
MQLLAEGLAAKRGGDFLFHGLTFRLESGEALVVTGRNGSGKSTLLRVVAGLLRPEVGSVLFFSESAAEPLPAYEACHYLGHKNGMKAELTVHENLDFWRRYLGDFQGGHGMEIDEAADAVGLSAITHLPYGYLSAGQQRRFAMARLLIAWRPVWLLDEPTAALDARADRLFSALVRDHLDKGGIVLAATHQPLGLGAARTMEMKGFDDSALEAVL